MIQKGETFALILRAGEGIIRTARAEAARDKPHNKKSLDRYDGGIPDRPNNAAWKKGTLLNT